MQVKVLMEAGYEEALRGMSYSFKDRALPPEEWWDEQQKRAYNRATLLAHKDGGHNKFLESIQVWLDVEASRAFWSEFDTYRVGTTKQSESTMHTLAKREPTYSDFEGGTLDTTITTFQEIWAKYKGDINVLKCNLPEGFLQRRLVNTNYKSLKNIYAQRLGHRFKWWDVFLNELVAQLEHPEFL